MKKVYIIHENTKPIRIRDRNIQIATDYVCCVAFIKEEHEKEPSAGYEYEPVFMHSTNTYVELENKIPGVWFETYDEGCKVLTKLLNGITSNYKVINERYDKLSEKYPEAVI